MGSLRKALVAVAIVGAWAGVGSALFVLVTPGEERVQAMLKEMPGQDLRSREEAARTKQLVLATLQEAAATQENVTWRKNWISTVVFRVHSQNLLERPPRDGTKLSVK